MSLLLAPVLAQLIAIGVQDRTEVRRVVLNDKRYEAQTSPGARVSLSWAHADLSLRYGVSLLVLPLESAPRDWLAYHTVGLTSSYRLRRTTFTFSGTTSFGELNFETLVLTNPASGLSTPGGAGTDMPAGGAVEPGAPMEAPPAGGTPQQVKVVNRSVRYAAALASLEALHAVTRRLHVGGNATYSIAGGLDESAKSDYPLLRSTTLDLFAAHTTTSKRDTLKLEGRVMQTWSSNGNHASTWLASETWLHSFDGHFSSLLGAGLSLLRIAQDDGLTAYTILPTFSAGIGYDSLAAGGRLSIRLNTSANPAPDQLRGTVDPRIGGAATVSWTRDRFRSALSGNAALSVAAEDNDAGALAGYGASAVTGYQIADPLAVEAGARMAKQDFEGQTLVPLSYALFFAVIFDQDWKLNRRR